MSAIEIARAASERMRAPGYGTCYRCERPWKFVKGHSTPYVEGRACFPLCEGCWAELATPEARMPYYETLLDSWLGHLSDYEPGTRAEAARKLLDADWPAIRASVEAGN